MNLKSVRIKNFKSIEELHIELNPNFNVIIGQNNIGKTTIIEAMLLWKKCYDINVTAKGKNFYATSRNLKFAEIENLRVTDDMDLFHSPSSRKKPESTISIEIENEEVCYSLTFTVIKVGHLSNAYFQISYENPGEFPRFAKLSENYNTSLRNLIVFTDTRPVSNIISNEPYMYRPQIRKKINKGKGYEVLRNKIVKNESEMKKIEDNLSKVLNKTIRFIEKDKDNKEYIKLLVSIDGVVSDIVSQGSGFLQIADIFSSFEFFNSELNVLLIDEPDSHIHLSQQNRLIDAIREIPKSQAIVISHNERFIDNAKDEEILFLNQTDKKKGYLKPLERGAKCFVIEDLVGKYEDIDQLRNTDKIIIVEGEMDKIRISELIKHYKKFHSIPEVDPYIFPLDGIDDWAPKLDTFVKAREILSCRGDAKWVVLNDTDCIPFNRRREYANTIRKRIPLEDKLKSVILQQGYEFESTLFSEVEFLCNLLNLFFGENLVEDWYVEELNSEIVFDAQRIGSKISEILELDFDRQKHARGSYYKKISFKDFIKDVNETMVPYIMSKKIIDIYLKRLIEKATFIKNTKHGKNSLDAHTLFSFYLDNIRTYADIHPTHKVLIESLLDK